jgi:hypothetical protein
MSWFMPLGFPLGVDFFAYTLDEFARLESVSPGLGAAILTGITV